MEFIEKEDDIIKKKKVKELSRKLQKEIAKDEGSMQHHIMEMWHHVESMRDILNKSTYENIFLSSKTKKMVGHISNSIRQLNETVASMTVDTWLADENAKLMQEGHTNHLIKDFERLMQIIDERAYHKMQDELEQMESHTKRLEKEGQKAYG